MSRFILTSDRLITLKLKDINDVNRDLLIKLCLESRRTYEVPAVFFLPEASLGL